MIKRTRLDDGERPRAYISNLSKGWSREAQLSLLGGFETIYEDELSKTQLEAARRSRTTNLLKDRDNMLRPTSRKTPETIHAASPVCLALSPTDLGRVLAAAAARNATVVFHDSGLRVPPDAGAAVISEAIQALETAKRSASGKTGRPGYETSSEKRVDDAKRRVELIREDWAKRDHITADLLARAGHRGKALSFNTAVKYLGRRALAQKKYDDHLAYLVRKAAKKEQKNDD